METTPRKGPEPRRRKAVVKESSPGGTKSVSPEEMAVATSGPSVYVNKTVIAGMGHGARLTFLEVYPDHGAHFRASVMMDFDQLLKLKELITKLEENLLTLEIPVSQLQARRASIAVREGG